MPLKNKSQEKASFAVEAIKEFKGKGGNLAEFKRYAKRLPSMILRNGLILTLAFYKAKSEAHQSIYQILCRWFKKSDLLEELMSKDALTYRQMSKEALEFATWLQRIADAEIEEEESREER